MRQVALGLVWMVCFSGLAQDRTQLERWACLADKKCQKSDDSKPEKQEFARTAKVGQWWTEEQAPIQATFAASRIESDGDVVRLNGDVEIATSAVILEADEADYHWDTGEIDARGRVHVRPIPFVAGQGLRQFGLK
jgi:lipopolysaccharide assembly outer membrane protein LptD (OstA)